MSDSATVSMRNQLIADICALDRLALEVKLAESEQSKAKAALADAKAAVARANTRVANLRLREDLLIESVAMLSRSLSTLSTFPFELLSMIFAYANTERERRYPADGEEYAPPREVDSDRVLLPWRLAGVCRHWRAAVRSTPEAWSYIGISTGSKSPAIGTTASFRWRLLEALDRSGTTLLDVVFTGSFEPTLAVADEGNLRTQEHTIALNTLDLLVDNMHRVRTLGVSYRPTFPRSSSWSTMWPTTRDQVGELLRAPSPELVDARLRFVDHFCDTGLGPEEDFWYPFPGEPFPLFLPAAPKLRYLLLDNIPVAFRRPHPGLPSLERISITQYQMYSVHVADMLSVAPKLHHLELHVREALSAPGFEPNFQPALSLATLDMSRSSHQTFGLLVDGAHLLPNLSSLDVSTLADLTVTEALARRLTSLRICGLDDLHDHLETLRRLRCVEHLALYGVKFRDDIFFGAFCDPVDPMMPKLKTLKLTAADALTVEQDGILHLVRARNGEHDGTAVSGVPVCPLEDLDFDGRSVPSWIAVQVRAILPEREDDDV